MIRKSSSLTPTTSAMLIAKVRIPAVRNLSGSKRARGGRNSACGLADWLPPPGDDRVFYSLSETHHLTSAPMPFSVSKRLVGQARFRSLPDHCRRRRFDHRLSGTFLDHSRQSPVCAYISVMAVGAMMGIGGALLWTDS